MNFAKIGAAVAGVVGLSYSLYRYFFSNKQEALDKALALKIIKEIKFQMFSACISFVEGVNSILPKLKDPSKKDEVLKYFETQMIKIFQQKQNLILNKYGVNASKLTFALQKVFHNEKQFIKIHQQIESMMLDALQGKIPDLTVPSDLKRIFDKTKILKIFQEMLMMIALSIFSKFMKQINQNPSFNMNDNTEFLRVVRGMAISDLKLSFLQRQGFNKYEGCPNQNFAKIVEQYKKQDQKFKSKIKQLEKQYQKFIQDISTNIDSSNDQNIKSRFQKIVLVQKINVQISKKQKKLQQKPATQNANEQIDWYNAENIIGGTTEITKPIIVPQNTELQKIYNEELWYAQDIQPNLPIVHQNKKLQIKVQTKIIHQQLKQSTEQPKLYQGQSWFYQQIDNNIATASIPVQIQKQKVHINQAIAQNAINISSQQINKPLQQVKQKNEQIRILENKQIQKFNEKIASVTQSIQKISQSPLQKVEQVANSIQEVVEPHKQIINQEMIQEIKQKIVQVIQVIEPNDQRVQTIRQLKDQKVVEQVVEPNYQINELGVNIEVESYRIQKSEQVVGEDGTIKIEKKNEQINIVINEVNEGNEQR